MPEKLSQIVCQEEKKLTSMKTILPRKGWLCQKGHSKQETVQKGRGFAFLLFISSCRTPIRSSFEREAISPDHHNGWRSRIKYRMTPFLDSLNEIGKVKNHRAGSRKGIIFQSDGCRE